MDEYAIEEALKIKEAHGGEVTILTMGPERATESIRKALSMGPDKAVHVLDDALHGSCARGHLEGARRRARHARAPTWSSAARSPPTAGCQVMPHMLAERLGIAALTGARKLTVDGSHADHRAADRGGLRGGHRLDAGGGLASGTPSTSRGTRPSRASWRRRRSRCRRSSLADLGIAAGRGRLRRRRPARWSSTPSARRARAARKVTDEGEGGVQAGRVPRLREVRLRGARDMAEVLVVVEASGGAASRRSPWRC